MNLNLEIELASIRMDNPLMLASGILGICPSLIRRVAAAGAGAIVTKSIGLKAREGFPNPTVHIIKDYGLINAMGLPNPGVDEVLEEFKGQKFSVPVIYSIYGSSPEEYSNVAKKLLKLNPVAFELNLSCPHVREVGQMVGQDPEMVYKVVNLVKSSVNVPVFAKLSPNVTDILEIACSAVKAGVDGIVAINTVKAMAIDIDLRKPVLGNVYGGLSGPSIKPIAIKIVYDLFENFKVPIVGVGGVSNWKDAIEYFLAGARAVQIGSGVLWKGLNIFGEILSGLRKYMQGHGFKRVEEIVGAGHK
ncbi:MAG: dihydroorotate dehydrogenase [Nitrososphaeria archaeon]